MATTSTTAQAEALERVNLYSTSKAKPTSNSWEDRTSDLGYGYGVYLAPDGQVASRADQIADIDHTGNPNLDAVELNKFAGITSGKFLHSPKSRSKYLVPMTNYLATEESAQDINSYLASNSSKGYSLTPGDGRAAVDMRQISVDNGRGSVDIYNVPIYGKVSSQAATPAPPKPGATAEDGAADDLYDSSQDVLYGRNGFGARPQLETDVPAGKGTDSVARYGNDMRWRNFEFSDAMNQRAGLESSRMGRMMQYTASTLPAAPKSGGTADLIDALTQLSNVKSKLFA